MTYLSYYSLKGEQKKSQPPASLTLTKAASYINISVDSVDISLAQNSSPPASVLFVDLNKERISIISACKRETEVV